MLPLCADGVPPSIPPQEIGGHLLVLVGGKVVAGDNTATLHVALGLRRPITLLATEDVLGHQDAAQSFGCGASVCAEQTLQQLPDGSLGVPSCGANEEHILLEATAEATDGTGELPEHVHSGLHTLIDAPEQVLGAGADRILPCDELHEHRPKLRVHLSATTTEEGGEAGAKELHLGDASSCGLREGVQGAWDGLGEGKVRVR